MAGLDLSAAIQNFDPKKHYYLAVKKEKGSVSLTVSHKTRFGRLWMAMGISNASMTRVLKYLIKQSKTNSESLTSLSDANKSKLLQRVEKFAKKHKHWCKKHQIANLINQLKPSTTPHKPEEKPSRNEKPEEKPSRNEKESDKESGGAQQGKAGSALKPSTAPHKPEEKPSRNEKESDKGSRGAQQGEAGSAKKDPLQQPENPLWKEKKPAPVSQRTVLASASPQPAATGKLVKTVAIQSDPSIEGCLSTTLLNAAEFKAMQDQSVLTCSLSWYREYGWNRIWSEVPQGWVAQLKQREAYLHGQSDFHQRYKQVSEDEFEILTLQDLDLPYEQSAFMIMLLTKQEFFALTLEDIERLSPRQADAFSQRAKLLEQEIENAAFYISMHSLDADAILKLSGSLADVLWSYISETALRSIPVDQLNDRLMELLFTNTYNLERVTPDQLKAIVPYLEKHWTEENWRKSFPHSRIKDIVFNSKKLFHTLFPPDTGHSLDFARCKEMFTHLSKDAIDDNLAYTSMVYLSDEQLQKLNGAKLTARNLKELQELGKIEKLNKDQITACWNKFDEDSIDGLTGEQLGWLNPSDHKFTKELFESRFSIYKNENECRADFGNFNKEMVAHLFPFMKVRGIAYMSDDQIRDLDPSLLTVEKINALAAKDKIQTLTFDQVTRSLDSFSLVTFAKIPIDYLQKLDPEHLKDYHLKSLALYLDGGLGLLTDEKVKKCWGKFDRESIKGLSPQQVGKLNPQDHLFTKPLFEGLFPGNASKEQRDNKFEKLSSEMVNYLLQFMEKQHMVYVSAAQVPSLDSAKMQKRHIDGLAESEGAVSKITYLTDGQVNALWDYFDGNSVSLLSESQIRSLDTSRITKEQFDRLFEKDSQNLFKPKIHEKSNKEKLEYFTTQKQIQGIAVHLKSRKDLHKYLTKEQKMWAEIK